MPTVTDANASRAAQTAGAIAALAEERKIQEVQNKFHVSQRPESVVVPVALEMTGAWGTVGLAFSKRLMATIPTSDDAHSNIQSRRFGAAQGADVCAAVHTHNAAMIWRFARNGRRRGGAAGARA